MSVPVQRALAAVLWLWIAAFSFVGLDEPIGDGDEHVHATILRDMLRSGDYLQPRWQGEPVLERPLVPYWAAAPFSLAVPGEVGVRLASALASFAVLVIVFSAGRTCFGRSDAAFVAVLLLAGSPCFRGYGRALMSDPWLVLGTTLALASALRARREPRALVGVAVGVGLAIAAKSLIALVPTLALLPWLVRPWQQAPADTKRNALLVLALLALPYYALETALHGERFLRAHFGVSLAARALDGQGIGLPGGVLGYVLGVPELEGALVATWLALGSAGALAFGQWRRDDDLRLLGGYALCVLSAMSLLATRLPHYVLPAYPAAALGMAGLYVRAGAWLGLDRRWPWPLLGPALALAVSFETSGHPSGAYLLRLPIGRELGPLARRITAPGETLYTLEYFGPSLGYYAERPVELLTENPRAHDVVGHFLRSSRLVPPPPVAAGSTIVIAAEPAVLAHAAWLRVEEVVARSPPIVLARARVVP